jgi:hypothetical protein
MLEIKRQKPSQAHVTWNKKPLFLTTHQVWKHYQDNNGLVANLDDLAEIIAKDTKTFVRLATEFVQCQKQNQSSRPQSFTASDTKQQLKPLQSPSQPALNTPTPMSPSE